MTSPERRFDKFTERARKVLNLAEESARQFNHNYIGTEHMLIGLLREAEGVGAMVLRECGVELDKVRQNVETIAGRGDPNATVGLIGLTPRGKHAIELAVAEARAMKHGFIGTEHLLLGLLREEDGIASRVLTTFGVTATIARQKVVETLEQRGVATTYAPPKDNVIACRVDDETLEGIDALVESGVRTTRSDAANWLIRAGAASQQELLAKAKATASQVRELRATMQTLADAPSGAAAE